MDKKQFFLRLIMVLAIAGIVIVSVVMATKDPNTNNQLSVSATGKVTAIPDIATITVGVYTEAQPTAAEAVKNNTDKMNDIISALKGLDIEKKDITTSNYNLNPVYNWTESRGQVLRGYEVRQNVTIKIRDLDKIGQAIQVTTEKGANQIGGISFTIDDPEDLKTEARNIAIAKAKTKAEELAKVSGIKLGKLINVYENQVYYPDMRTNVSYAKEAYGVGGGGDIPEPAIEAGEQEVQVEIYLVYEVK